MGILVNGAFMVLRMTKFWTKVGEIQNSKANKNDRDFL